VARLNRGTDSGRRWSESCTAGVRVRSAFATSRRTPTLAEGVPRGTAAIIPDHICQGRSHELSRNREAVADRKHAELDARIVPEPGVEGAQGHGVLGAVVLVGHLPAP